MAINKLNRVTYNDFQLAQIIDPDKFDKNFRDCVGKIDEIVEYTNSLDNTTVGETGASKIGTIYNGEAKTLQDIVSAIEVAGLGNLPGENTVTNNILATDVKVGSLSSLTTTNKVNITSAINEIVTNIATNASSIGTLSSLNTTDKSNLVNAINELLTYINSSIGSIIPAGEIKYFARNTAPTGYLKANGLAVSRTTYANLFSVIGTTFGAGDGSTTFNLPDLRGVFPRGWDDNRGFDSGRAFGSYQADDNKSHTHTGTTASNGAHTHDIGVNASWGGNYIAVAGTVNSPSVNIPTSSNGAHTHTFTTDSSGTTENLVKNVALLACIKY